MGDEQGQDNQNEATRDSEAAVAPEPATPVEPSFGNPPGFIPEPKEKSWNAEPPDAFDGVDRGTPFEGRPPSEVVQPAELPVEHYDDPSPSEPLAPGQPLPRRDDGGSEDPNL